MKTSKLNLCLLITGRFSNAIIGAIALKRKGQRGRGDSSRQQVCYSYCSTEGGSLGNVGKSNSFHKYCEREWSMKLGGAYQKIFEMTVPTKESLWCTNGSTERD